jgi:hypothetical protein
MTQLVMFPEGNYLYLPGAFQYSWAVMAEPGFEITRVRFSRVLPIAEGFAAIASHLKAVGRPLTALCAGELRSPGPFTEAGFVAFNRSYVGTLADWGIFSNDVNPVARSNVCPMVAPPAEPGFYGFSYTVPKQSKGRVSFVTSGAADCPEGLPNYRDHIIRLGDVSPEGLKDKVRFALGDLESRFDLMEIGWADVAQMLLYTVHDVHALIGPEFAARGAISGGLEWHYCRPPVQDIETEMDARNTPTQIVLTV